MADFINLYVNTDSGNDSNDGLTETTPKKTILSAASLANSSYEYSIINIMPGEYDETSILVGKEGTSGVLRKICLVGYGDVVLRNTIILVGSELEMIQLVNLSFKVNLYSQNQGGNNILIGHDNNSSNTPSAFDCWMAASSCSFVRDGQDPVSITNLTHMTIRDSTIHKMTYIYDPSTVETNPSPSGTFVNDIIYGTPPMLGSDNYRMSSVSCASDISFWIDQIGGVDCDQSNPAYNLPYDYLSSSPDTNFNESLSSYDNYMSMGVGGAPVGRVSFDSISFGKIKPSDAPFRSIAYDSSSYDTYKGWSNDDSYFDPSYKSVSITADFNDRIVFEEGGTQYTAIIPEATYATIGDLSSAIASAMTSAGSGSIVYSCYPDGNNKLQIVSDSDVFTLKCTNTNKTAWSDIGFDTSSDIEDTIVAYGKSGVVEGPSASAKTGATYASIDGENNIISPRWEAVDGSTHCRIITSVENLLHKSKITRISIGSIGSLYPDTDPNAPGATIQVRGSDVIFDKNDPAGTTPLDWTDVIIDNGSVTLPTYYKYWQFAIEIRR